METNYWTAKRELNEWNARRDAIYQERALLRKNRELSKAEHDYIYARMTEQLVEVIAIAREYARVVGMHERHGMPSPFHSLSAHRYPYYV